MITNDEIIRRVKTGVELYEDKTYDPTDLANHLLQIITDVRSEGLVHKNHLERWIYKFKSFSPDLRLFVCGHSNKKRTLLTELDELDHKCNYMLSNGGYNIDRFIKEEKTETGKLFD